MGVVGKGIVVGVIAVALWYVLYELPRPEFTTYEDGVIVVTGASSGIGKDAAIHLAKQGYTVLAGVRKDSDGDALKKLGIDTLMPLKLDVTKEESVAAAVATVEQLLAKKDTHLVGLVNNAGVSRELPAEIQSMENWRFVLEVNVFGVMATTQAFIPLLRKSKGRIINVSSLMGMIALPYRSGYSTSKFALEGFSDSLRREMNRFGVSVSVVQPGFVKTSIGDKSTGDNGPVALAGDRLTEDYRGILESEGERRAKVFKTAPGTEETAEAISHALTSTKPKTRYIVSSAGTMPGWLAVKLMATFPTRFSDFLLEKLRP